MVVMDLKELLDELRAQGISDRVIDAMKRADRRNFVPEKLLDRAYENNALPIGAEQTISQPYTVGFMLDKLELKKGMKVLEIGAGSGWNSALISLLAGRKVYSVELVEKVAKFARQNLRGYNVEVIVGDGSKGHEKEAPYDRIIVTAGCRKIPEKLIEQLKSGGILIAPVGAEGCQEMVRITKIKGGSLKTEYFGSFVFVPLK